MIVAGFGIIFGGRSYSEYKIGVLPHSETPVSSDQVQIPDGFRNMRFLKFIGIPTKVEGLNKLEHHKIDFLLMFTLVVVWAGCDLISSFRVTGSYWVLILVFCLGSLSLTALGLVLASRGTSEEFTTGIFNFISWPMMFLSEVWFSLEGAAPQWVKSAAQIFPLPHLLKAARKIMHDGAEFMDVGPEIIILSGMTLAFLTAGASLFSWNK